MPFVCAGHPFPNATVALLPALERGGARIAEIGIPFSDPIADGPVIAAAMHSALQAGVTPDSIFEQVAAARPHTGLGLVAMVSVSIVHRRGGPRRFVGEAKGAGFDGFIFPDAPLDESEDLIAAVRGEDLAVSLLIAPTTTTERAARIVASCSGFVYLLATSGITGERAAAPDVGARVAMLRGMTDLPIACGFGLSTPAHVRAVVEHADAAIVGSALVKRLTAAQQAGRDPAADAEAFVSELATGL